MFAQFENAISINDKRMQIWNQYYKSLKPLADLAYLELASIPDECNRNAHLLYIKVANIQERTNLVNHLKANGINAIFHYVPLHSSVAGSKHGYSHGDLNITALESERILRLPLYFGLSTQQIKVINSNLEAYYAC